MIHNENRQNEEKVSTKIVTYLYILTGTNCRVITVSIIQYYPKLYPNKSNRNQLDSNTGLTDRKPSFLEPGRVIYPFVNKHQTTH